MKIRYMLIVFAAFFFFCCDQYPIFYAISQEVKPTEPRIKGSPTNIVELGDYLYVASRFGSKVHRYTTDSGTWDTIPSPGAHIMELATDGTWLYALVGEPTEKTVVLRYNEPDWEDPVSFDNTDSDGSGIIQTICGANDGNRGGYLFAGSAKESTLKGAAFLDGTYYVAIVNSGIFTLNTSTSEKSYDVVGGTEGKVVVGILTVGDKIVAVTRAGELLYGDKDGFTSVSTGVNFSGSMALWRSSDSANHLLLLGIQGGIYSTVNGYREILLDETGSLNPGTLGLRTPGENSISTVSNRDRYVSTMGLHVATSLYQATNNLTLFASSMKNGLWSYRSRGGEDVWNAEE